MKIIKSQKLKPLFVNEEELNPSNYFLFIGDDEKTRVAFSHPDYPPQVAIENDKCEFIFEVIEPKFIDT